MGARAIGPIMGSGAAGGKEMASKEREIGGRMKEGGKDTGQNAKGEINSFPRSALGVTRKVGRRVS